MRWAILVGTPSTDDPKSPWVWSRCPGNHANRYLATMFGLGHVTSSKEHLLIVEEWRVDALLALLNATEIDVLAAELIAPTKKVLEKPPEPVQQTNPNYWK